MYNEDAGADPKNHHRELWDTYEALAGFMGAQLIEHPFPQTMGSLVSFELMTKFHTSLLAERLLLNSGFCHEAYCILRLMLEYTITLKFILLLPEERAMRYLDDNSAASRPFDFDIPLMADETHMQEWLRIIEHPLSGCSSPLEAGDLLVKSCELTSLMLETCRNKEDEKIDC
ncbi:MULTISPECIES: hypothetical protein [unclassified Paenibacillus]|uniref:hypothetical protein n=1 Tax=unclassified Paenibacillus TaxID=185978 RepID=UPI0004F68146|nr:MULTISPECIES: hypothetical protein [unclassified Paenibacillus]AIQ30660.1 hypothetical protein P40081_22685 [Paenibacillus sp. FSL P4-0081]OMF30231.1 hypothetical protein BK132_08700 [Paenibacillus sp. FSL H8-0259]